MYKDWRLRNSADLWRPNSRKHISGNGTSHPAKTREKQQGWDGKSSEQAGAKMQQKNSPARSLQRNENNAFSCDVLERSGRSKISPYSRSVGRCRSTSSSWNSRLSSGDSDVTCRTTEARIAAHLRAEEESCQELAAEGQVMHRSVEQQHQTRARIVESLHQTEESILHPTTVRDIAIHPTLKVAQIKGDGNNYTPMGWDSTNSYSESRHVQWQVSWQQSPNNSSSASTEASKHLRDEETTRAESESVFLDEVQSQSRDMELKLRPGEDCKGLKTVAAEQKFGPPLNKFITGGALHALASLTRLDSSLDSSVDFSEVERPGAATEDLQEALQNYNHIRENLGESQVKDLISCNAGPILPEKPKHRRALCALATLPRLGFSEAERPDAATGDLQQVFEQRNHIREHFGESQVENLRSSNAGPILPEKPTQKKPFPATDSQGSSLANNSEGQSVIMRANIAFEPAAKEAAPVATVYMRKKIKMKAPTPKLSSRAKKPKPTACDAKDASVLQIGEREREEDGQKQKCPDDDCTILDAEDLESLRRSTTIANDEGREDEKAVTDDARKHNTCVVTHNEHSIEVQELQDPPCRRRWPKVLPVCTSVSNRTGAERSSISSICESLQEERISMGGNADSAAVQHEDMLERQATNPSSEEAIERLASTGAVSVDDGETRNTEQYKEGTEQENCSSKDAAVVKPGLRICIPSASVREISINSASRIQPWTLLDAHRLQGEEGKLKKFGNEFQSNRKSPASSALSYLSSRDPSSVMPEENLRRSATLQESKSFVPVSNPPGPTSASLETFGHQGAIPERETDDPSNESSASTIIVSSNSSIAGRYPPGLALATLSRGQLSQQTPESIEFGRGVLNSALPHEETYAERASLSSEKLCSILSYLGHVEESNLQENYNILQKTKSACYSPNGNRSPRTVLEHDGSVSSADSTFTATLTNVSNRSPTNSNANSGDGESNRNKAVSLFEGVRKKIQYYKDRIAGHESQNAELLKDMERVTADKEQTLSREREKFGRELEKRAAEYEAVIQHHLALNEKMIKDKETLSEKCYNLSTAETKFEEKLKVMQEQHTQDLKKQKELWIAGEKPKREAWKEMKLKEIKEITIKGLEPHIECIVEKNKQEMLKQEMRCADDKQKKLELQAIQHRKEMSELRDRLLKERDDLLEKERMAALQKMNEVAEKYEQQAMQLRMRVSGDMAAELERAEESRRKDKHDAHELLSKFQKEAAERDDTLRKGFESAMQKAISKREDEISKLKNEWQNELDAKLQEEMQIKEQEIQARCTKERDEQIEMIIERMDMEKDDTINQQQQDLLVKVERLMEEKLDFMKRMKEVESKCATLCQLSLEAKKKAELELENRDLQVASLERELSCQSDLIEKLKAELNQEKSNLTQQEERFEKRIKKEQELLESALRDVAKCSAEAQQMRSRKVEELAEVEAHVRQAIDNKDLVITGLREQLLSAREQIRHTEQLLLL